MMSQRRTRVTHLLISREYPPASYLPGGIGTYLCQITRLLAESGDTVHVIAHRWTGAPRAREEAIGGRLVVHRVDLAREGDAKGRALIASPFPAQAFSWQAALLAEHLIDREGVDVIEAQEWEAPLYFLQLRRALGLGPARRPPCVVHLHSPSEQIFAANDWDTSVADYQPAIAQEAYSIAAADALICPSRYVGEQAIARYHIDPARLTVIRYPLGDAARVSRTAETWSSGSICYIGRLELRKGVVELADAIKAIADEHPSLRIDLVGRDTPFDAIGGRTAGDEVRARLPQRVRHRVRFHGHRDRDGLRDVLSKSWAAVVPSRWDNLPYSCIESMASGLPVVATPTGGMRELIEDGRSGWIAADATPAGIAGALRRALATSPADRERMGCAAADAVAGLCDNTHVVAQHRALKGRVVSTLPPPPRPVMELSDVFLDSGRISPIPLRYSSMAQGLRRLHMPLLRWLLACAPADQRAFVRQGLKHPARSARWLANQARLQWQGQTD
jgi:glycosyltransferase involved in cell wall biosynthesis